MLESVENISLYVSHDRLGGGLRFAIRNMPVDCDESGLLIALEQNFQQEMLHGVFEIE